jgi:hypothetical protein
MSKCSHNRLKRKLIGQGKDEGRYTGYCSQQCKRMIEVEITTNDIRGQTKCCMERTKRTGLTSAHRGTQHMLR